MRILLLGLLSAILDVLAEIVASWADKTWGLSQPNHATLTLAAFGVALASILMLEAGVPLPGRFAFHRLAYVSDLARADMLRRWANRFAPLHLGKGPRYIAAAEALIDGDRRNLVDELHRAFTQRGETGRRILILGEPGCGKSTALERLALDLTLYSFRRAGFRGPIPLLLRANEYKQGTSLREIIAQCLQTWAKGPIGRALRTERSLDRLIGSARLVLLCDGLDELGGQHRDQLIVQLDSISRAVSYSRISVVVTCRTRQDPGQALPLFESYSILDLSDDAVLTFLELYSVGGTIQAEKTYQHLRSQGLLDPGAMGRNPFWLDRLLDFGTEENTRAAILLQASRKVLLAELQKPHGSTRSWSRPANFTDHQLAEECERALDWISVHMNFERHWPRDKVLALVTGFIKERQRKLGLPRGMVADQLLELARDAGLLHRAADPISFSHRIIQEFYEALHLLQSHPLGQESLTSYLREPARWTVLGLFASLLAENDREDFIRNILSEATSPLALPCAIAVFVEKPSSRGSPIPLQLLRSLRETLASEAEFNPQLRASLGELFVRGHDPAAAFIGQLMADPSPSVRVKVCELLAMSEAPEALRVLSCVGLDDDDEGVAEAAADALVATGPRAVRALLRHCASAGKKEEHEFLLPRPPAESRRVTRHLHRVADALGRLRAAEAVNYLLRCPGDDSRLGSALAQCASSRPGRLILGLALGEASERRRAIFALASNPDPKALRPLVRSVADEDTEIRSAALSALETWETSASRAQLSAGNGAQGGFVTQAIVEALHAKSWRVRQWAVEEIRERTAHNAAELGAFVKPLLRTVSDENIDVRESALGVLKEWDWEGRGLQMASEVEPSRESLAIQALQEARDSGEALVNQWAVTRLARLAAAKATDVLDKLDKDEEDSGDDEKFLEVSLEPSEGFGIREVTKLSRPWGPFVPSRYKTPSWVAIEEESREAVAALASNESGIATDKLLQLARSYRTPTVIRCKAIEELGRRGGEQVITTLLSLMNVVEDGSVREAALASLHCQSEQFAVQEIAQRFAYDQDNAEIAFWLLSEISHSAGEQSVVDTILAWFSTSDAVQRHLALLTAKRLIEVRGQNVENGPELAVMAVQGLLDPYSRVRGLAEALLAGMPLAWSFFLISDALSRLGPRLHPAISRLVGRCCDQRALQALIQTSRAGLKPERIATILALGQLGNPWAWATLSDLLQRVEEDSDVIEAAKIALVAMAWEVRPELTTVLYAHEVAEPLLTGAVEALGLIGDISELHVARLLELLSQSSPEVAKSSAFALAQSTDATFPRLSVAYFSFSPAARSYADLLLRLLQGNDLPRRGTEIEGTSAAQGSTPEEVLERMALREHLQEAFRRFSLPVVAAILGGTLGFHFAGSLFDATAGLIYGVPSATIIRQLPLPPYQDQLSFVILGAWFGCPVFLYQLWNYMKPGLFSSERRLLFPSFVLGIGLCLSFPLSCAGIAALLRLLYRSVPAGALKDFELVWTTNRATILVSLLILWFAGFKPLRRFLTKRAREQYVLSLSEGKPVRRQHTPSARLHRAVLITAATALILLVFAPVYLTTGILLGALLFVGIGVGVSYIVATELLQGRVSVRRTPSLPYLLAIIDVLSPLSLWSWPTALLLLAFGSRGIMVWLYGLCGFMGEKAPPRAPVMWEFLVLTVFSCRIIGGGADAVVAIYRRKPLNFLGGLTALVLLILPVFVCRFLRAMDYSVMPDQLFAFSLSISTSFALVIIASILKGRVAVRGAVFLLASALVLGCLPSIVFAGAMVFGDLVLALGIPAFVDFAARHPLSDTARILGIGLSIFRKASKELTESVKKELHADSL